jgi:hypothetical protein
MKSWSGTKALDFVSVEVYTTENLGNKNLKSLNTVAVRHAANKRNLRGVLGLYERKRARGIDGAWRRFRYFSQLTRRPKPLW